MADWRSSMQQTYEFYTVDPNTWGDKRQIKDVISCTILWDASSATLGSATIDCAEMLGETYVRIYLIVTQKKRMEKFPMGTFLVQTPGDNFDGKTHSMSMEAYTPLLELKEKSPPIGYSVLTGVNIMNLASTLCRENVRAPVIAANCPTLLETDFVADTSDTWLTFLTDLIGIAKYGFLLDEMGRVLFAPDQDVAALQPVWTYDDSNSSILYPSVSVERDLYGIPNVVEVMSSTGAQCLYSRVVNKNENSPISTVSRGREIVYRDTNPSIPGIPTQGQLDLYAQQLLKSLSSVEYTVSYTHGYSGTRVGDCVRLTYERAGLKNIKAKITSQSIECKPGCPVTETAVFTSDLWG